MSLSRRLSMLEWARRSRAIIFEDDYDSEYRYSGRPIPALQGLDRAAMVIFAGSFTDALFPALRLAYLVVPWDMVDIFAAAESVSTHHPPLIDQAILCDFIQEGHFARHVRRMRELYAERLSVLVKCAQERLGGLLQIPAVEAGLRTVGWLQDGILAERAAQAAAKYDVEVLPLSRYAYGRSRRNGLCLASRRWGHPNCEEESSSWLELWRSAVRLFHGTRRLRMAKIEWRRGAACSFDTCVDRASDQRSHN